MTSYLESSRKNVGSDSFAWTSAVFRGIVGLILLFAAAAKTHSLASNGLQTGFDAADVLLVLWEVALAVVLWLYPSLLTWIAGAATFAIFSVVSFGSVVSGAESCGCFGMLSVPPLATLMLDLFFVAGLSFFALNMPRAVRVPGSLMKATLIGGSTFVTFSSMLLAMSIASRAVAGDSGIQFLPGNLVVLEPERWIGERFPLVDHIEDGDDFLDGDWEVLLYRPDCSECRELISKRYDMDGSLHGNRAGNLAAIGIDGGVAAVAIPSRVRFFSVDQSFEWLIETPCLVEIRDGVVESARHGKDLAGR